ncbi:MAG: amino acid racemase [Bryobacteraceae bacterium]|jgi:aspartate racemase
MSDAPLGRCIGLIGGLGVGASVYYYQELAKAHAAWGKALNLVMAHAQVDRVLGAVQAGDKEGLASYLAALIARLQAAGAEFAVIPAVAPHIAIAELIQLSPLPIVNLIDEIRREVQARQLRRVALFGTRFAVESRLFGRLDGVEVVTPHPDEVDYIHATYLELVGAGAGLAAQREGLSRLAHKLMERDGVQAVILAGTELALVFDEGNTDFPNINSARLHLDAIVRRALLPP